MTYEYIRAEDYCDSVRDGTHDTPKPVENGYKLVTGKHIRDGRIDPTEAYYISEKDYRKINERSKVDQWDVLMSMIGNGLGRSAVVDDIPNYAIKNIALFKVGDETKAKWLHYYLSGKEGQGRIYNSLQGSGQPFISLSYIRDFPVPNPPQEVMKRVVGVLGQYDFLIDNNQKQIKLLEEAAQRLYKEWFVDLRFPGYEDTPFEDGLPAGWKKCSILDNEIFIFAKSKVVPFDGQKVYYATADVTGTQISGDGEWVTFQNKPSRAAIQPLNESVWFARMSNSYKILNCFGDSSYLSETAIISSGFAGFTACKDCYGFVYATIASKRFDEEKNRYATGATQVSLTNEGLKKIQVVLPTIDIAERYSRIVEPYIEKAEQLKRSIWLLSQARDRLLPKLMSGEIEV